MLKSLDFTRLLSIFCFLYFFRFHPFNTLKNRNKLSQNLVKNLIKISLFRKRGLSPLFSCGKATSPQVFQQAMENSHSILIPLRQPLTLFLIAPIVNSEFTTTY